MTQNKIDFNKNLPIMEQNKEQPTNNVEEAAREYAENSFIHPVNGIGEPIQAPVGQNPKGWRKHFNSTTKAFKAGADWHSRTALPTEFESANAVRERSLAILCDLVENHPEVIEESKKKFENTDYSNSPTLYEYFEAFGGRRLPTVEECVALANRMYFSDPPDNVNGSFIHLELKQLHQLIAYSQGRKME